MQGRPWGEASGHSCVLAHAAKSTCAAAAHSHPPPPPNTKVVVLWTANTERYSQLAEGLNDTAANLLASIARDEPELAPSTLYAVACVLEGVPFINGSPQNTFVPGLLELAVSEGVLIAGDDFKSGQTKMKSVLVDYLVGAGLKPTSIVSYNHLGNNDGMNLSAPATFRSKEISKSNVVDDMVASNALLYEPGEHPDHVVVIKYVPYVGDSKRALDEYTSEIFMGGRNTIVLHNTCEDSLLAAPIILDLVLIAELLTRVRMRRDGEAALHELHPVAALLSYLTKAPLVPQARGGRVCRQGARKEGPRTDRVAGVSASLGARWA